jgi:hypothetical protein
MRGFRALTVSLARLSTSLHCQVRKDEQRRVRRTLRAIEFNERSNDFPFFGRTNPIWTSPTNLGFRSDAILQNEPIIGGLDGWGSTRPLSQSTRNNCVIDCCMTSQEAKSQIRRWSCTVYPRLHRGVHLSCRCLEAALRTKAPIETDADDRIAGAAPWLELCCFARNIPSANNFIRAGYRLYQPRYPWAYPATLYWRKFIGSVSSLHGTHPKRL